MQGNAGTAFTRRASFFVASVADFAGDDERLLIEVDGLGGVAQVGVGIAEISEGVAFVAAVTNLAGEVENGRKVPQTEFCGACIQMRQTHFIQDTHLIVAGACPAIPDQLFLQSAQTLRGVQSAIVTTQWAYGVCDDV